MQTNEQPKAADVKTQELDEEQIAEARAFFGTVDLPGIKVQSEDMATLYRYVRVKTSLEAELVRVKAQAKAMVAALEGRLRAVEFVYGRACEGVAKAKVQADNAGRKKQVKSFKTPFGTVGFRSSPGGVVVEDAAALIEAATKRPELAACVKQTPSVVKAEVDKYVTATGDLPPGCDIEDPCDVFYVQAPRVAGAEDDAAAMQPGGGVVSAAVSGLPTGKA